jgi:anti-sigma B factor antagonist
VKIITSHRGRLAIISISGRIDVYTASSVGEAIQSLIADGAEDLIVDVSCVTRIDSTGLSTLVGNAKTLATTGGSISLAGSNQLIRRTLEITNLGRYFRMHEGIGEALDELEACALGQTT